MSFGMTTAETAFRGGRRAGLIRHLGIALFAVFAIVSLALPYLGSPVFRDINFQVCLLIILAISWNLMAGAGLISLGHSAFWGLGSYAAILSVNKLGLFFGLSLVPSVLAGALVGAGLALVTGRLKGIYFAIATLAASEGLRVIAVMLPDLTGGSNGIYLDSTHAAKPNEVYLAATLGAIGAAVIAFMLSQSRYHFALRAMRNSEMASRMLGVEPLRFRIGIMSISGAMASFAGAVNMWRGGYLDPAVAFDLLITINSQIAPILGGIYTLGGPIIGAIVTMGLGELARIYLGKVVGASLLIFGLVLVVMIMYMPNGIIGAWRDWQLRRQRRVLVVRPLEGASKAAAERIR
jgi:branched-chain amino acid transport system permease protein